MSTSENDCVILPSNEEHWGAKEWDLQGLPNHDRVVYRRLQRQYDSSYPLYRNNKERLLAFMVWFHDQEYPNNVSEATWMTAALNVFPKTGSVNKKNGFC